MCDEEVMELIFDMYQDMIEATPGVDYFLVSKEFVNRVENVEIFDNVMGSDHCPVLLQIR